MAGGRPPESRDVARLDAAKQLEAMPGRLMVIDDLRGIQPEELFLPAGYL
jgi:hypothetical protein